MNLRVDVKLFLLNKNGNLSHNYGIKSSNHNFVEPQKNEKQEMDEIMLLNEEMVYLSK